MFDEARYFVSAEKQLPFHFGDRNLALAICEDAWNDQRFWTHRRYGRDPVEELIKQGGDFLININSSPYWTGKRQLRRDMVAAQAKRHNVPVVWVNQVGGNDQLVFDGSSFAMDAQGSILASACSFAEDLVLFEQHANHADECEAV